MGEVWRARLELPYPPSVNHYYRISGSRLRITKKGLKYRHDVAVYVAAARHPHVSGRVRVVISCHPPDGRCRDIDNPLKPLLDALQHANVYDNDKQIDDLRIVRCDAERGGLVVVNLFAIEKLKAVGL